VNPTPTKKLPNKLLWFFWRDLYAYVFIIEDFEWKSFLGEETKMQIRSLGKDDLDQSAV